MLNLIDQRNSDFMAAFAKEIKKNPCHFREVLARVASGPAPRYYVGFDAAVRNVAAIINGRCSDFGSPTRTALYTELANRTRYLISRSSKPLSISSALARVMASGGASSFFITLRTAADIYYEQRRFERRLRGIARHHMSLIA